MNAINILEQQHADEVLRLEIAYSNLYKAYVLGDRNEMINHYIATGYIGIPNFAKLVQSKTKQEMLSNRILPDILPTSIDNIKDDTLLRMNIVGCLKALQNEINIRNIYRNHYTYAQKFFISLITYFGKKKSYTKIHRDNNLKFPIYLRCLNMQ